MFVCWTSPRQDETPVCHDCSVVNGTSKFIINISYGTAARVLTSGHPPETIIRVLTYGHSPGPPHHDIVLGIEGLQAFTGIARNGNRGVSSGEQGLRNKLRERIGLLKRFVYCTC